MPFLCVVSPQESIFCGADFGSMTALDQVASEFKMFYVLHCFCSAFTHWAYPASTRLFGLMCSVPSRIHLLWSWLWFYDRLSSGLHNLFTTAGCIMFTFM